MFVKDRMNKNTISVNENTTLAKTLALMKESKHKRLPVTDDGGRPVGVANRYEIEAVGTSGLVLSGTKIRDIMSARFFKVNENTLLEDCALVMKDNKAAFLPVVDNDNVLSGVITSFDVLKGLMRLIDISGEGCRMMVNSPDAAGIASIVGRGGNIRSIFIDDGVTVVKFYAQNASEIKDRVNSQYDVIYFVEK